MSARPMKEVDVASTHSLEPRSSLAGLPAKHTELIRQKNEFLVHKMDVNHLFIAELYATKVIDNVEKGELDSVIDFPQKCNAKLLSILESKSEEAFKNFIDALIATDQENVAKVLCASERGGESCKHEVVIQELCSTLIRSIMTRELIGCLYSKGVIGWSDMEKLTTIKVESVRCAELLRILQRKSPEQFELFIQALDVTRQSHVACQIRDKLLQLQ